MNPHLLHQEVQDYINNHLNHDASKIALAKSPFKNITSAEIAGQISAKKKAQHKLPTWFKTPEIYYPPLLSIEQTSSEITAAYKANLIKGEKIIDITSGFGIDSFYFSKKAKQVYSCEINPELAEISAHNSTILDAKNINVLPKDGIEFISQTTEKFDTIYVDPARRKNSGKVFKLADCTPNIVEHLDLLLSKTERIIIKTAPLLDITAGLNELKNVSQIHIVSVKNECKELLWVINKNSVQVPEIICVTLNQEDKFFTFYLNQLQEKATIEENEPTSYLYEPDVAILKSGAFNLVANKYSLHKLHQQSHLYFTDEIKSEFPGRIFEITTVLSLNDLKKEKSLKGNVIVRNFPQKAENLVKKYKITPSDTDFIIFTKNHTGYLVIKAKIIQHY